MANSRLSLALVGTFVVAIVLLQVSSIIHGSNRGPVFQVKSQWDDRSSGYVGDDGIHLLGAGKADITGLVDTCCWKCFEDR
jgi:neutral ceramidase